MLGGKPLASGAPPACPFPCRRRHGASRARSPGVRRADEASWRRGDGRALGRRRGPRRCAARWLTQLTAQLGRADASSSKPRRRLDRVGLSKCGAWKECDHEEGAPTAARDSPCCPIGPGGAAPHFFALNVVPSFLTTPGVVCSRSRSGPLTLRVYVHDKNGRRREATDILADNWFSGLINGWRMHPGGR